jgi:hypothetical protein
MTRKTNPALPELPTGQFFRVYETLDGNRPHIQLRRKTWYGSKALGPEHSISPEYGTNYSTYWVPSEADIARVAHNIMTNRAAFFRQQNAKHARYGDYPPRSIGGDA